MKKKLLNNWGLKLLAVVSAVLLWLLIMNNNDPVTTFTVSGIPIEFLNEDTILGNSMVYEVIGSRTASVSVTTRTKDRDKITASDFRATADLNDIFGYTSTVQVRVELVGDADAVRDWQQMTYGISLALENIVTRTFPIEIVQEGEVEDGYVYRKCTLSSESVTLRAPESELAKVAGAKVTVDLSQSSEDGQWTEDIVFFNAAGRTVSLSSVEGVTADRTSVEVNVMVQKTSPVSLDVVVLGRDHVAPGYRYITYRISQQSVSVIGTKQAVAGLDKIQIEVDATGASGDVVKEIDVRDYLPDNVSIAGEETTVTIRLLVEQEGETSLEVPVQNLTFVGQRGGMIYQTEAETVTVNLFGLVSDWESVTGEDIRLTVDVSELTPGEHTVFPEAAPIDGLILSVPEEITVMVSPAPSRPGGTDEQTEPAESTGSDESEPETSETQQTRPERESGADESAENPTKESGEHETGGRETGSAAERNTEE